MSLLVQGAGTTGAALQPDHERWGRRVRRLLRRLTSAEVLGFLVVGGVAYVVDVGTFNALRSVPPFATWDPIVAKVAAVGLAMVVTYLGNAFGTWRGRGRTTPTRLAAFVTVNLLGLGVSVVCLWLSHDLFGWTSRLADNISANGVGLVLGTGLRFWCYRRFVFR